MKSRTFRPVLPDPDHVAAAARTGDTLGFNDGLDQWQVIGQSPRFARCAQGHLVRIGGTCRDLVLDGGDLGLSLGDGRLKILQCQFQLRGVQLFRFRPELCLPVLPDLTLQLLDQLLQLGDEGFFLGHDSLLMLARSTLDRCLKPGRFQRRRLRDKGLHHPRWKVWKLAEIEGLRHAAS